MNRDWKATYLAVAGDPQTNTYRRALEIWAWYRVMCEEHDQQVEILYGVEPSSLYPELPEPIRRIEQDFAVHMFDQAQRVLRYEGIGYVESLAARQRVARLGLRDCQDWVRRARWFDSGEPDWKEDRWQKERVVICSL
jgi:hypothetical protein